MSPIPTSRDVFSVSCRMSVANHPYHPYQIADFGAVGKGGKGRQTFQWLVSSLSIGACLVVRTNERENLVAPAMGSDPYHPYRLCQIEPRVSMAASAHTRRPNARSRGRHLT